MSLTIGFANKFYTLWNVDTREECVNEYTSRVGVYATYIQNVSFDKATAVAKYPNAKVDESLRGKSRSFWVKSQVIVKNPYVLTFGKYAGQDARDVAKFDAEYVLWASKAAYNEAQRDAYVTVPEVQELLNKRNERYDAIQTLVDGEVKELTFERNLYLVNDSTFCAQVSIENQPNDLWLKLHVPADMVNVVSNYYGTNCFLVVNGKNKRTKNLTVSGTVRVVNVERLDNGKIMQTVQLEGLTWNGKKSQKEEA